MVVIMTGISVLGRRGTFGRGEFTSLSRMIMHDSIRGMEYIILCEYWLQEAFLDRYWLISVCAK